MAGQEGAGGAGQATEYDDDGRVTKMIENYADGTPGGGTGDEDDRVTVYTYTDGLRATMKADMPGSETDQTTTARRRWSGTGP